MIERLNSDPTPVYYKLQMRIQKQIEEGQWAPGENIPTERELIQTYGLSSGTVKKALLNLVNAGYLYRIQGKGTFVAGTTLRRGSLRYYRFQKDFRDKEIDLKVELLSLKKIKGQPEYNVNLQIGAKQELYQIRRLFTSGGNPVVYSTSYMPFKMFPNLEKYEEDFSGEMTLYRLLEKEYNVTTVSNKKMISVATAQPQEADLLKVQENYPLLFIEMMSFTYKNKPYECRQTYCLTDNQKLVVLI